MSLSLESLIHSVDDALWGWPLIVLILGVGLLLTLRTGIQRYIPLGIKHTLANEHTGDGEVSSFGALCTALSATIGTGNIVGVATAICTGGPGALLWMEVAALIGIATKYSECMLAIKYREIDASGHVLGGPFYYIEKGMGKKWTWLGKLFALFGTLAGLMGIGTITQVNGIVSVVQTLFQPDFDAATSSGILIFGVNYSVSTVIGAITVTLLAALVIIGGLKRISSVAEKVVPLMAIIYIVLTVSVIICNITNVPSAIKQIVVGAFKPSAVSGALMGVSVKIALQEGVSSGLFSNEAGLGSAPIAAAAVQTDEPVRQGLVSMLGTFIDTIIVCTLTGLSVVLTGAWNTGSGIEGAAVTATAFQTGLPLPNGVSTFLLMLCLAFFAFTTILGWDYYSERCLEYLTGSKKVIPFFRFAYILAVLIGPFLTVNIVWTLANIFNGLMAFPNLIALIALSGVVAAETKGYFARHPKG